MPDVTSDSPKGVWWTEDDERRMAGSLTTQCLGLRKLQSQRDEDALIFLRLYGGKEAVNFYMGQALGLGAYSNSASQSQHGTRLNVIQSCCDTVNAKITLSKPKITFLTSGGTWAEQRKAKKLEQFSDGVFYLTKQHQLSPKISLDAQIFGTGVEYIFAEHGRIKHEKVMPLELTIDEVEGAYGNPRNVFRTKLIQKEVLAGMFPDFRDEIWKLKGETYESGAGLSVANMLPLVAAWHLPSSQDSDIASDGKCAIAVGELLLYSDEWTRDYAPFAFLRWAPRSMGFWGQGLAEQLLGIQVELNNVTKTISEIIRLCAVPKIYVENGSKVNVAQLDRTIGAVVKYSGVKPEFGIPMVVGPELTQREQFLYDKAFSVSGTSQLSASSKLPAGLEQASGKALETFLDAETERFSIYADAYQQFHMDVCAQDIDLARELYGAGDRDDDQDDADLYDLTVSVPGAKFIREIKWSEIDLENDAFVMQRWPTNFLADDPADRMKQVQDMSAAGWIDANMAADLMDFPDLRSYLNLKNSGVETIKFIIDEILESSRYIPPEPFFNLQLGIQTMQSVYGELIQQDAPDMKKALVRKWIAAAQDLINPPAPAAMPGAAPPSAPGGGSAPGIAGGPPTAVGAAPPVSPLVAAQMPKAA